MKTDIRSMLDEVERSTNSSLHCRREVEFLLETASERGMDQVFEDSIFLAKFVVNAMNVVRRTGSDSNDTSKLVTEISTSLEKVTTLLRTLVKETPETERDQFVHRFLSRSPDGMTDLLRLLGDLAQVKNYYLDRRIS